jgi:hypothetical protein
MRKNWQSAPASIGFHRVDRYCVIVQISRSKASRDSLQGPAERDDLAPIINLV